MPIMVSWGQTQLPVGWGDPVDRQHLMNMVRSGYCWGSWSYQGEEEVPAESQPVVWPHASWSEHRKKSGSRVLVTGIHEGENQSLVGVEVVSKGPGVGSKCSRYYNWSTHRDLWRKSKCDPSVDSVLLWEDWPGALILSLLRIWTKVSKILIDKVLNWS